MARKYETVEIDETKYELHGVKADDKKIGFVPVRMFADDPEVDDVYHEFTEFVGSASVGELELIIADWKYGNGVRLQGMARKCVSGGGYTDADHNKIFNELSTADGQWLAGFVGRGDALDKACRAEWDRRKAENPTDTDESKVWEELL